MSNNLVSRYSYDKNNIIITYKDGRKIFIKKKKKYDLESVYKYLDDHDVNCYLRPIKINSRNIYFEYLEGPTLSLDEKAKRLLYTLSILQNKTTIYKEIDKDKLKEKYDKLKNRIDYLFKYYRALQDAIENKVYMSPSEYLFIRNVTIIYEALYYSSNTLETWYNLVKNKKTERLVYCHGKCELDHFIAKDNGYFISLEKAHLGSPVTDFLYFYNKNYSETDMISNFKFYQHRYLYTKEELLYLLVNITIPEKIDIYPSSLCKCMMLTAVFDKLKLTGSFVLNYQKNSKNDEKYEFSK